MAERHEDDPLLTSRDAALLLGLTTDGVRRLALVGELPYTWTYGGETSGQRLFRKSDVERLVALRRAHPPRRGNPRLRKGAA